MTTPDAPHPANSTSLGRGQARATPAVGGARQDGGRPEEARAVRTRRWTPLEAIVLAQRPADADRFEVREGIVYVDPARGAATARRQWGSRCRTA